jgi:hypothetical protein
LGYVAIVVVMTLLAQNQSRRAYATQVETANQVAVRALLENLARDHADLSGAPANADSAIGRVT